MKRVLALMMSLVMCAGLAACGGSTDSSSDDTASVYYLNFKPEQDAQWQELIQKKQACL